jgi:hypothetical protein
MMAQTSTITAQESPMRGERSACYDYDTLHGIEKELSEPLFRGIPIGPSLADCILIDIVCGQRDWSTRQRWTNRARWLKYWLRPQYGCPADLSAVPQGKILVTRLDNSPRFVDLTIPLLAEFGKDKCLMLCRNDDSLALLPAGVQGIAWNSVMYCEPRTWRAEFRRCWPEWERKLRSTSRRFALRDGAFEALSLQALLASQNIAACLVFLGARRPAAIVTEYDRNHSWSSLIMAARLLGIPSFGLVHGVADKHANPMVPVLADTLFAWSEMHRQRFIEAGEDPQRILVGGCPRITRTLSSTPAEARARLGLDIDLPAVMLGTAPYRPELCFAEAETFCRALGNIGGLSAFVRIHPSQTLEFYRPISERYAAVRFFDNSAATLDESLAAADIVVMRDSGIGGDALVKKRLVVVLETHGEPLVHGQDLIDYAGCPRATRADELAAIVQHILADKQYRQGLVAAAEQFVRGHCEYFGQDSARRISQSVLAAIPHEAGCGQ